MNSSFQRNLMTAKMIAMLLKRKRKDKILLGLKRLTNLSKKSKIR